MGHVEQDIHGIGRADAAAIRRAIVDRGKRLAAEFAPGGIYREPSAGVEHIILDECHRFPGSEVDADGVVTQINEETAGMQSLFWVERANPGGIGAIDSAPGQAIDFTVDDRGQKLARDEAERRGIRAHVAKLRNYRFGEGPWSAEDPRFAAVRQAGYLGIAKKWRDLQGRWASSQTYAASLEEIWAALDRIIGEGAPMQAQIPGFTWQPADAQHYSAGRTAKVVGGAQHYSDGTNSLAWLTTTSGADDPTQRVSAGFLVKHNPTMADRGWQLVRLEDTAWATAFANPYTVPIEYEHDGQQPIPDIAYEVLAQTWKDIDDYLRAHNLGSIDAIRGHKEWVNNPTKICPDGIDVPRIQKRFDELKAGTHPAPAPDDGLRIHLGNGVYAAGVLRGGFRAWVEQWAKDRYPQDANSAALSLLGDVLEDEWYGVDGHAYQRCRNLILHYMPNTAEPWDVTPMPANAPLPAKAA